MGASAAADAAEAAFDADDDSDEDTEDATLPAGSRSGLVGTDLFDQVPVELDSLERLLVAGGWLYGGRAQTSCDEFVTIVANVNISAAESAQAFGDLADRTSDKS